jgi:alpha-beta hydrolase superfamily lysophospholipase
MMSGLVGAADRDVCFEVDGTATYGTLHVPAHREGRRLAAALLLPGSGPVDRDGDVPRLGVTPRTLKLIAGVLARHGVMSLRFDKYFTGRTGAGAYAADPARIDLAAFIRQATAGYHLLGRQPEARADALLIAGHSEGALYALLAAQHVRPYPAGLALIQPMAEPLLSTVELQATAQLIADVAAGRLDSAVAARNAAGVRHAIGEFRAGRPVDTSGLLPGIVRRLAPELLVAENARYVRQGDAVHPLAAAATVKPGTRVLVTAGTSDGNIPVSAIRLLALVLAGAGATGPGLRVLAGIDHFLHPAGTPCAEPVLAPAAVAALADWSRPYAAGQPEARVRPRTANGA